MKLTNNCGVQLDGFLVKGHLIVFFKDVIV